jgi:hypothetical protein
MISERLKKIWKEAVEVLFPHLRRGTENISRKFPVSTADLLADI